KVHFDKFVHIQLHKSNQFSVSQQIKAHLLLYLVPGDPYPQKKASPSPVHAPSDENCN
ncbi:hypothetical protein MKX03_031176, partial [Papaver bracteatum]